MVSAIVLAAGESRRMRRLKLLLPLEGKSMLGRVVDAALGSQAGQVIVVLGKGQRWLRRQAARSPRVQTIFNPDWREGMATSLHAGLRSVSPQAHAVIFLLADQPLVDSALIDSIIAKYEKSHKRIVLPMYNGRRGNPVLFDLSLRSELLCTSADEGGRSVIEAHPREISTVHVADRLKGVDVDTWQEYLSLQARLTGAQNAAS
ncbi:MAG: molybdenum cofactor cytidylyltransferase [Chloroflexi bacterium]|nr:molybdenum cofactor cytidylyltransferase [Chloroflexota bacterium]